MRFHLQFAAGLCAAGLLAGCASHTPAPAPASSAPAAQRSRDFEAMASKLHSPKLMARVLLQQATEQKDGKRAILAAYFALRAHADKLADRAADLAHKLEPESVVPHQLMVRVALDNGNIRTARKQAAAVYKARGADAVAPVLQGPVDPWFAYAVVRPLAQAHPHDPAVQLLFARTALQAGDDAAALKAVGRAAGGPGAEAAQFVRIQALWGLGQRGKALHEGAKALAAHPKSVGLRVFFAGVLTRAGNYRRARETLDDAAALAPGNGHVILAYAVLDAAQNRDAAARERLTGLLEEGGQPAGAYHLLGRLAARQQNWGEAFGWYQAVDDGDFLATSGVAAAYVLAQWKDLATARSYLGHLEDVAPALMPTWLDAEAGLLQQAGRIQKAYGVATKAARDYPMVRPLRYQRAILADTLGKTDVALRLLHTLVSEDPHKGEYLNAYGYTLTEHTQRYREALGYIKRALAVDPDDGAVLDSMGWVLYRLGRPAKAVDYLRRAWKQTGDTDVAEHLVKVCIALGRTGEASRVLHEALAKAPGNAALKQLRQRLPQ